MIFMGNGRAEEGHDAIAHDLVDGALVAVDGLHHALQDRVEELAGLLGVAVGQQLHGALQVGKQHRDLLALAFEGAAGGEDLLGEVRRGVRPGARVPVRCACRGWRGSGGAVTAAPRSRPARSLFIHRQALAIDELVLQIFQGCVIELELPLEGAVGQASTPLEHGHRLVEDLLKGHRQPSLCL